MLVTAMIACVASKIQMHPKNSNIIRILSIGTRYSTDHSAEVTIIRYKPLSDMNFARRACNCYDSLCT